MKIIFISLRHGNFLYEDVIKGFWELLQNIPKSCKTYAEVT